jgi:predicted nucleic acid-binding protein
MSAADRVFFDTNVLVYAHDASDNKKRETAQALILAGLKTGAGVISAQVLSEFYVTVTRKIATPLSLDAARQELHLLSRLVVVETDSTLVLRAAILQEKWQTSFWDALILAAAERARCVTVWSEDLSSGQTYGAVRVLNPFAPAVPRLRHST